MSKCGMVLLMPLQGLGKFGLFFSSSPDLRDSRCKEEGTLHIREPLNLDGNGKIL
jgi:hypothetical protein